MGNRPMTRYIAIFETTSGDKYLIEYRPCYDEVAGGIEVLSIEHTKRPATWAERRAEYQRTPIERKPRQMELLP